MVEESLLNELQKLFREFDANSGMASMVCGRPLELMAESEQKRIIGGFCTEQNLQILSESQQKLEVLSKYDLPEKDQIKCVRAISILKQLVKAFASYKDASIARGELRTQVRAILQKPIPDKEEELVAEISRLVERTKFLAEQDTEGKDDWDRMIDFTQMHDVLSRTSAVCTAIKNSSHNNPDKCTANNSSLEKSIAISEQGIECLESYFIGDLEFKALHSRIGKLLFELGEQWSE